MHVWRLVPIFGGSSRCRQLDVEASEAAKPPHEGWHGQAANHGPKVCCRCTGVVHAYKQEHGHNDCPKPSVHGCVAEQRECCMKSMGQNGARDVLVQDVHNLKGRALEWPKPQTCCNGHTH